MWLSEWFLRKLIQGIQKRQVRGGTGDRRGADLFVYSERHFCRKIDTLFHSLIEGIQKEMHRISATPVFVQSIRDE